jgi:hypothetical protein
VKRKAEGLVAPIELKNNDLTAKIVFKREELQTRRDDRLKISEAFYTTEGICCTNMVVKIDSVLTELNVQKNKIIVKLDNFEKELENVSDVVGCVLNDSMIASRYDMLNMIMYIDKQKLLGLNYSSVGSRVINNGEGYVTGVLGLGYLVSGVELR